MAATLSTPPPARAFSDSPIWIALTTDEPISAPAEIVLTITSSGPSDAETLRLEFDGNDLTFTVTDPITVDGLALPVKGAETLAEYADTLAERLAGCEVLHSYFSITRSSSGAETITLTQRLLAVVDVVVTNGLTNVSHTSSSVTEVTTSDALRGLVEVWTDTGNVSTDVLLISLHSPYLLPDGVTTIDIRSAFALLRPHLPPESQIYAALITELPHGEATSCWSKYYLRYADKSGLPAVAQYLQRSASYIAILGAQAVNSLVVATTPLRHNYVRADGSTILTKPITDVQPDWMYWVCPTGVIAVYMSVTLYWSDGTESNYLPYGTDPISVVAGKMYYFGTGAHHLNIGAAPLPGGADPEAYVVGYMAAIVKSGGGFMLGVHSVTYTLHYSNDYVAPIFLFSNGMGGCETVAMRGKTVQKYLTTSEEYARPRSSTWTAQDGDFSQFLAQGRGEWDVNTGWVDIDYIQHLKQLPLSDVWMVDLGRKKFLRVLVQPGEIETNRDDETLFALTFTIRAGWSDSAFNL